MDIEVGDILETGSRSTSVWTIVYSKDDSTVNYKKEFCSQLATMFYKRCGFNPFAPTYPARLISPAQYYQSPLMDVVWEG